MKKIAKWLAVIFSVVLCTFCFSSCITFSMPLDVSTKPSEIVDIEIYYFSDVVYFGYSGQYYGGEDNKWEYIQYDDVKGGNVYTVFDPQPTPIAHVQQADYEKFITDVEALPFKTMVILGAAMDPAWGYIGYVVKIVKRDGYEMLCAKGGGQQGGCDEETWIACLQKYVNVELT